LEPGRLGKVKVANQTTRELHNEGNGKLKEGVCRSGFG